MDERLSDAVTARTEKTYGLSSQEFVYRHCMINRRDKANKEIPSIWNFTPSPSDKNDGMSVHAVNLTTPEESLAILGAQYKPNTTEFKDFSTREIYHLNVGYVRTLPKIKDVIHDPIFDINPPIGYPNNIAHSLITFTSFEFEDEPELFYKMRDHAVSNGRVAVDLELVKKLTIELRS